AHGPRWRAARRRGEGPAASGPAGPPSGRRGRVLGVARFLPRLHAAGVPGRASVDRQAVLERVPRKAARVRGRVRPPRVVQRLRPRPRGGGPRPGPSFAGAGGDRRAAGGHSPVVPVGLPCGGRRRRLSLGTGLLGLLTACWVRAESGPNVLVLSFSASDPERTSAGSQSRGAVSSCRVLWRTIGLVGPEASPHLDSERIRTRKNRPRIQVANFRWGLPIRDGDT